MICKGRANILNFKILREKRRNQYRNATKPRWEYIARSGDRLICMQMKNGPCCYFVRYLKRRFFYCWSNVETSGKSPSYVYKVSLLTMKARFSGIDSYSASLSGVLRTQEQTNDSPMITGQTFTLDAVGMQFSWDDGILDADADGMLDDWQHEAK